MKKKSPLYKSFGHAFSGLFTVIKEERNIKIHLTVTTLVILAGIVLHISPIEWCICLTLFGLVLALEVENTAIEKTVDLVTEEFHPLAKQAKDMAAGAVLIAAIMAAVAGLVIFIPKGIEFISVH